MSPEREGAFVTTESRRGVGPIPRSERSPAPDIARGAMLLFIAIANAAVHLYGRPFDEYTNLADAGFADRFALAVEQLFIAERARPMFAILYGFGIAVMASRMFERGLGPKEVRRVLRRRSWWLVVLGLLHAVLLFYGDILAPYGAAGLIVLAFVHLSDRALRRWFLGIALYVVFVGVPVLALVYSVSTAAPPSQAPALPPYAEQLITGTIASVSGTLVMTLLLALVPLVLVGVMLQRAGWIDRPEDHLPALRRVFVSGMAVNIFSALPVALVGLGVWQPSSTGHIVALGLTLLGGMYAGLGYICGFALLAHRWRSYGRRGVPGALAAVGERSLTCYLAQSFVLAPLLAPWGFGLGDDLGYLGAYGIAAATWLATVGIAVLLARAGRRGPFEVVLRRLTYGRVRGA